MMLMHVHPAIAGGERGAGRGSRTPVEVYDWGTVKAVGSDLFGAGLFPFEAISILLLIAVVGAIAIARPLHEDRRGPRSGRGPTSTVGQRCASSRSPTQ